MIVRRRLVALLLVLAARMTVAAPPSAPQPPDFRLAASPTTTALARNLSEIMQERGAPVRLRYAGSERAIEEVRSGLADAALIARRPTATEAREFHTETLAMDSLLLIVNERNPLNSASSDLVRKIFSREISDWRQVGAGNAGTIVPVTRRSADGTRTVFDETFGIGRVIPTGIVELASNLAAVLYVGADPQAIGYVSSETFDDARRRGLRIRALGLDGLAPAASGCVDGTYPLCRPIVLLRRAGAAPPGYDKIGQLLASEEGQRLLARHGFSTRQAP